MRVLCKATAFACFLLTGAAAQADPVAEFYKGKQIRLVMPNSPGGSTTMYGMAVSEFWQKHIPGNPTIALEYRTGASGIAASNYVYSAAPKDGTVMLMMIAGQLSQDLEPSGARYDAAKFSYIGRAADLPRAIVAWNASGLKSIEQAREKEYTMGAGSKGSATWLHPALMNMLLGTKFKIVSGYSGAGPMYLALERHEVDSASVGFEGLTTARVDWLRDNKVTVLATVGSRPLAGHPNVPNLAALTKTPEDREMIVYVQHHSDLGQVFVGPPDMHAERLQALRRAFDATMRDPAFLAMAEKRKLEIIPQTGEELQAYAAKLAQRDEKMVNRLRKMVGE
jgi:tripartite-type tricarboxylate transporter receptor subunit TctC